MYPFHKRRTFKYMYFLEKCMEGCNHVFKQPEPPLSSFSQSISCHYAYHFKPILSKKFGLFHHCEMNPDSKVPGANMGPIWGRQDPGGPHVDPMNFAIWEAMWGLAGKLLLCPIIAPQVWYCLAGGIHKPALVAMAIVDALAPSRYQVINNHHHCDWNDTRIILRDTHIFVSLKQLNQLHSWEDGNSLVSILLAGSFSPNDNTPCVFKVPFMWIHQGLLSLTWIDFNPMDK